jgi:hypothetical protein
MTALIASDRVRASQRGARFVDRANQMVVMVAPPTIVFNHTKCVSDVGRLRSLTILMCVSSTSGARPKDFFEDLPSPLEEAAMNGAGSPAARSGSRIQEP